MTSEPKSMTEKFVEDTGATYAYAYDKSSHLARWFGIPGYPHAVLLDPIGRVAWRGHPAALTDEDIQRALKGSLSRPLFAFGDEAKKVKKALAKGKWAKAVEEAGALGDEGDALRKSLAELIEMRASALEEAWGQGDYLLAERLADGIADDMDGMPQGDRADVLLKDLKKDKQKKAILKAQEKIQKLLKDSPRKREEVDELLEELEKIVEDHPGTIIERDGDRMRERLWDLRGKMRR